MVYFVLVGAGGGVSAKIVLAARVTLEGLASFARLLSGEVCAFPKSFLKANCVELLSLNAIVL